jgi:hypothetical protein
MYELRFEYDFNALLRMIWSLEGKVVYGWHVDHIVVNVDTFCCVLILGILLMPLIYFCARHNMEDFEFFEQWHGES